MQHSTPPFFVVFFGVSLAVPWTSASESEGLGGHRDEEVLKCPAALPEGMPKEFASLVQLAERINNQVSRGEIAAIQETLQQRHLWHRGNVMEVTLGFSSLGGINHVIVDLRPHPAPGEQWERLGIGRSSKTGEIRGFSQFNVLWDGSAEVEVRDGKIVRYREGYMDFDLKSGKPVDFGHIGLQVEWTPEGDIVREEYLKTRKPLKLNLNPNRKESLP